MPRVDQQQQMRFVRALLPDRSAALRADGRFVITAAKRQLTLGTGAIAELVAAGVLTADERNCRPTASAGTWLRRRMLEPPGATTSPIPIAQPQPIADESPLRRLAGAGGTAFLAPHQVEAGERFRAVFERAQLRSRLTMSYDAARTASGRNTTAHDLTDMAADARRTLAALVRALPAECADVVLDVCGFEKGLQLIETERQWPRRSAKLVLRIGLEQLARHLGLEPAAVGRQRAGQRGWMGEGGRPPMFPEP